MKPVINLFFALIFLNVAALCQSRTPNIGFEDGTFNNWQLYSGSIDANGNIAVNATGPSSYFNIYGKESAQILDQYGKFPVLCPNGSNYSVKISDASSGKKAERISYTFQAPATGPYSIIFNYAVVLDNPNHTRIQQPQFTAFVYDVTDGTYIDCPKFDFVAGSTIGFQTSTVNGKAGESISYRPWSTATIDLRGYLGKTIRIEFTVNDCTLGGHFGYAYLDVEDSDSISPITGNAYCIGQTNITLTGPTGFASYIWYTGDLKTPIGSEGQSITLPAPPDKTSYALIIKPYEDLGCQDTLYTTVNKINSGYHFQVPDTVYACKGGTFDLTSSRVVAGSDPDLTYSYYADSIATVFAYNPNVIAEPGQYYIKAVNKEGCSSVLPVYVSFALPSVNIKVPAKVKYPQTVDLTRTFTPNKKFSYAYFSDTTSNKTIPNPTAIKYGGTYYLRVTDVNGCISWYPISVTIDPPDPFILTAPTAFTPNGDGVNDLLQFSSKGYLEFGNVKIYNRSGQQVFLMKNLDQSWDGTFGGKQVPDGVYYWVFEGMDTYYNVQVHRSGSITLIR